MNYIEKNQEYSIKENPKSKGGSSDDTNPDVQSWLSRLSKAEKEAKEWRQECDESWREYLAKSSQDQYFRTAKKDSERYNLYWSNIQTQLPLLYSKTPVVIVQRGFDNPDPVARVAAMLAERLATQMIRETNFDEKMKEAAKEFLLTNRVNTRVMYDAYFEKYEVETEGQDDTEDGANREEERLEKECIKVVNISYQDLLFNYGLADEEKISWKAFRLLMSKQEAYDTFGDVAKELNYASDKEQKEEGESSDLACIWEIWDKKTKKVYYLAKQSKSDFLKVIDDPYELADFFPDTPFLFSTKPHDSLYPVPDFTETYDLYSTLHVLYKRIKGLIRAIRARAIYDKSVDDLDMLISDAVEQEFIGVDMGAVAQKGGLANVIQFFPVDPLSNSLATTLQTFVSFRDMIYDLQGISDILRGASDPETTAAAEKIKQRNASNRFSVKQKGFQELVKNTIQKMVDLALYKFSDDTLYRMMGIPFLSQADQMMVPQAIALLKSDRDRQFRIDIETDSTILFKEEEEKAMKIEMLTSIGGFLQNASSLIAAQPVMAPAMISLLLSTIRSFRFSKDSESEIEQSLQGLLQTLQQPQQPPPPDPMIAIQMQKMQLEGQKLQLEAQKIQAELQAESQKTSVEMQLKDKALRLEEMKFVQAAKEGESQAIIDAKLAQIKDLEVQIEQAKVLLDAKSEDARKNLELIDISLKKQEKDLEMYEKLLEEKRLSLKEEVLPEYMDQIMSDKEHYKAMLSNISTALNALSQKKSPKIATIQRDASGNAIIRLTEEIG